MTGPRYSKILRGLPASVPFVGPEVIEREQDIQFKAFLGANELGFGPSPKALAAMRAADAEIWKYPDSSCHHLKHALSAHLDLPTANIMIGEGIDGLLGQLARMLIEPGDPVVTTAGAYPTFNYHVTGYGGQLHMVPMTGDSEDPEALLAKAAEVKPKLIYFSNPNNPMGSWHDAQVVQRFIDRVPEDALLILDEAYIEFAPEGTAPALAPDHPNVIRMRTFSKAYGMAGARVGYAIGAPDLIGNFNKIRNHFGMNRSALEGAREALLDQVYLAEIKEKVANARTRIGAIAQDNGTNALPSATNFVAVDTGRNADFSKALVAEMAQRGIFVRMPFTAPQNRCIRVATGPGRDLDLFADALPRALAALN